MSRSYRHTPICGWCSCNSEKRDKVIYHHKTRVRIRQLIHHALYHGDIDSIWLPKPQEVSNVFNWGKDGKMRFDPKEDGDNGWVSGRKLMRK